MSLLTGRYVVPGVDQRSGKAGSPRRAAHPAATTHGHFRGMSRKQMLLFRHDTEPEAMPTLIASLAVLAMSFKAERGRSLSSPRRSPARAQRGRDLTQRLDRMRGVTRT